MGWIGKIKGDAEIVVLLQIVDRDVLSVAIRILAQVDGELAALISGEIDFDFFRSTGGAAAGGDVDDDFGIGSGLIARAAEVDDDFRNRRSGSGRGGGLLCVVERSGQSRERLLGACQVAVLESCADGGEGLSAVAALEDGSVAIGATLAEGLERGESLLRGGRATRLKGCAELGEIGFAGLAEVLELLVNGLGGGYAGCGVIATDVDDDCRGGRLRLRYGTGEGALQGGEGSLRASQIAGLQCLTDGFKGLGATRIRERLGISIGTAFAGGGKVGEGLLGSAEVSALERAGELLQVRTASLVEALDFLENRAGDCR